MARAAIIVDPYEDAPGTIVDPYESESAPVPTATRQILPNDFRPVAGSRQTAAMPDGSARPAFHRHARCAGRDGLSQVQGPSRHCLNSGWARRVCENRDVHSAPLRRLQDNRWHDGCGQSPGDATHAHLLRRNCRRVLRDEVKPVHSSRNGGQNLSVRRFVFISCQKRIFK